MGRTDAPVRWEGIPVGVRGLGRESWARLDLQVARFQQARRQLCLPGDAADASKRSWMEMNRSPFPLSQDAVKFR